MNSFWLLLASGTTAGAIFYAIRLRTKLKSQNKKYSQIINIDGYVEKEYQKIENYKINSERKFDEAKQKRDEELSKLNEEIQALRSEKDLASNELANIEEQLALAHEDAVLMDHGYYAPQYNFEFEGNWTNELSQINDAVKSRISQTKDYADANSAHLHSAGEIVEALAYGASDSKGRTMQINTLKLLLRAFNGECSSHIAKVNYKNVSLMAKRIDAAFDAINKLGERSMKVRLVSEYRDLRQEELRCVYEYEEWKQKQKEEQARIREQMREEEKAARELEKAKRDAEREAKRNADALAKARSEVEGANEKQREKLLAQIQELEKRMAEMEEKNRYISQAMLTKTGHVYIISNIGSFGDGMLKIGMTRRLDPMDRVKELGDASVPFPFDVHAMIRTSDAPALENALHRHFDERRVNLENIRKEFFYVTLDEIGQELEALKDELNIEAEIHLTMAAEAKQWRMSEARRKHLEKLFNQ